MATGAAKTHPTTSPATPLGRERRDAQRVRVRGLICDRGEVIDLSTKGMRLHVHRRWPEGHLRAITIVDGALSVPVEARCIWCRQEGMFSHVVGLAFQHTSEHDVERLTLIAKRHANGHAD